MVKSMELLRVVLVVFVFIALCAILGAGVCGVAIGDPFAGLIGGGGVGAFIAMVTLTVARVA